MIVSSSDNRSTIRHLSPVLFVADRQKTLEYYSSIGFYCDFGLGFVERDGLEIIVHETENKDRITPNYPHHREDALDIFAMVYGVEELYHELAEKGAKLHKPLEVNEFGMKEFSIMDPDGYTIGFGESIQD